jgi:hypothetical protein
MVLKRRRRQIHHYDRFCCTVGEWRREYNFGAIVPERKYDDSGHKERDHITITTKVRHHTTTRAKSSRKFEAMEFILFPDHALRGKWSKDAERIGMIFFDRQSLRAHVDLASDVYYSLIPGLAACHFKEITLTVRNLRYWRGDIQWIGFQPEETPSEEL